MAPISLQDLRARLYDQAQAERQWRVWGLYVHVTKLETLRAAYDLTKQKDGAPGIDGVTFEAIEGAGREEFLGEVRAELVTGTYRPLRNRRVEIPKAGGKVRVLGIPAIRDRVGQGGRSNSSWSRSSRRTFTTARMATDRSGRRRRRWSGCGRPSSRARRR